MLADAPRATALAAVAAARSAALPCVGGLGDALLSPESLLAGGTPRDAPARATALSAAVSGVRRSAADAAAWTTVLDVACGAASGALFVLTSDGALAAYDGATLLRRWVDPGALSATEVAAVLWARALRGGAAGAEGGAAAAAAGAWAGASLLCCGVNAAAHVPVGADGGGGGGEGRQSPCDYVVVNRSFAAAALAAHAAFVAATGADGTAGAAAAQPVGGGVGSGELEWHVDAPACGQAVARVQPRFVAGVTLPGPLSSSATHGHAGAGAVAVAPGTPLALLETLYLSDAQLLVAVAAPPAVAAEALLRCAAASDADADAHAPTDPVAPPWPRILAFDALSGAVVADLGAAPPASPALLTFLAHSCQLVATDVPAVTAGGGAGAGGDIGILHPGRPDLLFPPPGLLRVWDLGPLLRHVTRQRARFLAAATAPLSGGALDGSLVVAGAATPARRGPAPLPSPATGTVISDLSEERMAPLRRWRGAAEFDDGGRDGDWDLHSAPDREGPDSSLLQQHFRQHAHPRHAR